MLRLIRLEGRKRFGTLIHEIAGTFLAIRHSCVERYCKRPIAFRKVRAGSSSGQALRLSTSGSIDNKGNPEKTDKMRAIRIMQLMSRVSEKDVPRPARFDSVETEN